MPPQRRLSRPTPAKTRDSLVALEWNWFTLRMGIALLLTLRPLNRRKWDDHFPRQSGNSMAAKRFVRRSVRTSRNSASARSSRLAVRKPAAYLRECVGCCWLRMRTHREGTNSGERPARSQSATDRCGVHRRWPPGFPVGWKKVDTRSALAPDLVTSRDCHIQFLVVDILSILSVPAIAKFQRLVVRASLP